MRDGAADRTADNLKKTPLIAIIVVLIVLLGLLVRASMRNEGLDWKFRQEMAQRFDLEKRVLSLEKERAGLYARIKSLTAQFEKDQDTISNLQASLSEALGENKGLREELSRPRGQTGTQPAPAASGAV